MVKVADAGGRLSGHMDFDRMHAIDPSVGFTLTTGTESSA